MQSVTADGVWIFMRRTDYWISTCFLLTVIFMTAYTRSLIALTIRKILRTCTWREEISVPPDWDWQAPESSDAAPLEVRQWGLLLLCVINMPAIRGRLAPHVKELQQLILKEDGFLPGFKNEDEKDLALKAKITASSWEQGGEPEKVANGISRKLGEEQNGWVTKPGECLIMKWDETKEIREIRLTFESNFAYPIRVTMAPLRQAQQRNGVPEELVKDVKIELYREGKKTGEAFVKDNYQRLCSVGIGDVPADEIRVIPESTNGAEQAVIHEIRVYAK